MQGYNVCFNLVEKVKDDKNYKFNYEPVKRNITGNKSFKTYVYNQNNTYFG